MKARKQAVGLECLIELLIAGITAMVLLLGARSVLSGKMSAGELLVFLSYLKNMFRPVREFARYSTRLIRAFTAGERVAGLLHYLPVEYSVEEKNCRYQRCRIFALKMLVSLTERERMESAVELFIMSVSISRRVILWQ